jgi:hypothetical protein
VIGDDTKVSLDVGFVDRPMAQPVEVTEANRTTWCVDPEATLVLPVTQLCRSEQRPKQSLRASCRVSTMRLRSRVLQDAVALWRSAWRGRCASATTVGPSRQPLAAGDRMGTRLGATDDDDGSVLKLDK